jgi:hypothetical protein
VIERGIKYLAEKPSYGSSTGVESTGGGRTPPAGMANSIAIVENITTTVKNSVSIVLNSAATVLKNGFLPHRGMAIAAVSHTGPSATGVLH